MEKILAIVAILAALALIGLSLFSPGGHQTTANGSAQKSATITLQKQSISPDHINLQHGRVKLTITNKDTILHSIDIFDPVSNRVIASIDILRPNETKVLWVDLAGGLIERRYQIYDPTWKAKGMEAAIVVH